MRFFNTAGPNKPRLHYSIPPLERLDLDEVLALIRAERYFVLHAPRQTGKTSALLALRELLNRSGDYRCVYANVEGAQAARHDVAAGMRTILDELRWRARATPALGDDSLADIVTGVIEQTSPLGALAEVLARWARADPRPLVVFLDEIDALVGDTLISVLRQIRSRYDARPERFPQSVILCGIRDVRDYRIHTGDGKEIVTGGSAFNIKAESLRMGDFSRGETRDLLGQHTRETGQPFTEGALRTVWRQTRGQPWLVNALAHQACFRHKPGRDRARPITGDAILDAREELVVSRQTHLHQLSDKLREDRVRRVVEPLLSGSDEGGFTASDLEYTADLGLVARKPLRIANPIYAEVLPRELTYAAQESIRTEPTEWYATAEGSLDMSRLLADFQRFFREHSEHWVERFRFREAGPQLLLQAYLQRIVNRGGRIHREYGLGRRRTDLLIEWPRPETAAPSRRYRRYVVECKLLRDGLERTIAEGLEQTADYMERCGAEAGHLVVFDRAPDRAWDEKLFRREASHAGRTVTVWGA